jgi:hypothetical protein
MGPIFTGEVRLMALDFSLDPAIAAGATLSSAPVLDILLKRGETVVDGFVLDADTDTVRDPPAIVGNTIVFWVEAPAAALYLVRGEALGSNNEVIKARDVLIVE